MAPSEKNKRLICLCNAVPQEAIEHAIARGCDTLGKLFDATTAGCGPCGGTCQPTLRKMLESYRVNATFPDNPQPPAQRTRARGLSQRK